MGDKYPPLIGDGSGRSPECEHGVQEHNFCAECDGWAVIQPPRNVIQFPERPKEWDEAFSVSVARNGQVFVTSADGSRYPAPLMWTLSDLCKRMLEFAAPSDTKGKKT